MENLNDLKSWPFVEARRLVEHTQDKEVVVFSTGYGPSGPPHIGTFGEVARTVMVMNAFRQLSDKPMRLIVFSDDMDALRAIPENVPNPDNMLDDFIGIPLSWIPDPYETHDSYSAHNNAALCDFLDLHGYDYEFIMSSDCYEGGVFNETLRLFASRVDEISNIITHDYGINGGNRKDTYCPFLPINTIEGTVFELDEWEIIEVENMSIGSYGNGEIAPSPFLALRYTNASGGVGMCNIDNGKVKLQWKADWPMRWIALGIDYEMHGKDLIGSAQVGQRICKLLGKKAPLNYMYELFLDEDGEKISKSKGNGLSLTDWMSYSTPASVAYYMFQNPRKSRKLHFGVIPQMTDDYLKMLDKYIQEPSMDNPVWHIHNGDVPTVGSPVMFSMILNLVSITDTQDPYVLIEFIRNYAHGASFKNPILRDLINGALNYYTTEVLPKKTYRAPTEMERVALISLHGSLRMVQAQHNAMLEFMNTNMVKMDAINEAGGEKAVLEEAITSVTYEVGKVHFGEEKDSLRKYFKSVYEIIMGQSSGPRLPVFIVMLGIDEFLRILKEKIQ